MTPQENRAFPEIPIAQKKHPAILRAARSERLVVALLALIFTYGFFSEYLPPHKRVHLWSDIEGYHYPLHQYAFHALKEGRFPLWDATIYCGMTFVGNVQAAVLYPPSWLMYAASWRYPRLRFKAIEDLAFLHLWVAFLLCYIWLRGRTGKMASVLGAAVYAYSGYMTYELLHLGVVCAIAWLPLALRGVDQAVERRNWRPLWQVAASSALAFLAGYPAAWLACAMITLIYAAASRGHWRAAVATGIAVAASGLLAAAELLPALDARSLMTLEVKYGPTDWGWRAFPLSYLVSNWFDFNPGHPTTYDPGCLYLYLGLPALVALLWALWKHSLRPYLQPLITLAAALIVAHPTDPLIHVVERTPVLQHVMQGYHFLAGAAAMAALITAIGLDQFLNSGKAGARVFRWIAPAVIVAAAIWNVHQLGIWAHGGKFPSHGGAVLSTAIALGVFAAALWAFRGATGRVRILLAAIVLVTAGIDYKVSSAGRWFNAVPGDVDKNHLDFGVAGVDDRTYQSLLANRSYRIVIDDDPFSTDLRFWDLTTPQGFDPFLTTAYHDRIERWVKFTTNRIFSVDPTKPDMLQSLGVGYIATHIGGTNEPFLSKSPDFQQINGNNSFYRIYRYLQAWPPYHWEDPRSGVARVLEWTPENREFLTESERGGRFVLVEQFFPGWRAAIDGRPVEISRWDQAFQAIPIPPGSHRVKFEFLPPSFEIGAAISLLSFIGLLAIARSDRAASKHG